LNGAPGVISARYASKNGERPTFDDNIDLLLTNLSGKENRIARFKTVIALKLNSETHLFEGILNGEIIHERKGVNGFGYDPIFLPDGHQQTLAEMESSLKNKISHRAIAVEKLVAFLKKISIN